MDHRERKYQVFVSSTYEDLKEERDAVIKTILKMEHIPIGMEMFNAGDDEQWKLIKKNIDASDYYVLILGLRYGSETKEGISYTQKEYNYAKSKNIPIITLLKDENVASTPSQRENDSSKENKLRLFRKEASNKIAMFWKDKNELTTQLATSLSSEIKKRPGIGWIRTSANMGVIDNTINEWGLEHIFRLRADKNTEADGMLKKSVKLLDGIAFGLKTFRSAHTSDIEQCLRNGTAIRLLVMNPRGNFIKQREYEEDEVDGQISNSIEKLVEWAKKLKMTTGGNISVKFYNSMTLDFYWRIDNSLYVGPYLYGRASQATITYKFEKGGTGFQEYTQYFEDLWNDINLTENIL